MSLSIQVYHRVPIRHEPLFRCLQVLHIAIHRCLCTKMCGLVASSQWERVPSTHTSPNDIVLVSESNTINKLKNHVLHLVITLVLESKKPLNSIETPLSDSPFVLPMVSRRYATITKQRWHILCITV